MAANQPPFKESLKALQEDWAETLEALREMKDDAIAGDLFAVLEYLTFCDELFRSAYLSLKEIKESEEDLKQDEELFKGWKELEQEMNDKLQQLNEEYQVLSDETLRRVDDSISQYSNRPSELSSTSLDSEVAQNLDKELFLQELKDSLEAYREARESFISEPEIDAKHKLPEDLGEEMPEIDTILSQLDMSITSCNSALLANEIGD
ncbi:MAG: hypothetical protein ACSNEK_07100 [Parachlamydiaceae bacterium]